MGMVTRLTKRGATNQPIAAPAAMATSALMMRLRSSIKCSKKDICPPAPSSCSGGLGVLTSGWLSLVIGLMRRGMLDGWIFSQTTVGLGRGRFFGGYGGNVDWILLRFLIRIDAGDCLVHRFYDRFDGFGRMARRGLLRKDLGLASGRSRGGTCEFRLALRLRFLLGLFPLRFPVLAFDVAHLLFKRHLEVVRRLAKLRHQFAEPAGKLRQLVRSEKDQHHQKQHHEMRDTEHFQVDCSRFAPLWHHRKRVAACQTGVSRKWEAVAPGHASKPVNPVDWCISARNWRAILENLLELSRSGFSALSRLVA